MFVPKALGAVNAREDTLRVTVPKVIPYTLRTPAPGGYLLEGPVPTMLEIIARVTKKKLLVVNRNESHWGVKVNGSYTGFAGLVARGESDIFVGPLMPTLERMEMGDITPPYLFTEIHLMTPKPGKYVDPFAFVSSFNTEVRHSTPSFFTATLRHVVWIGLFLSMLLMTTFFTVDKFARENNTKAWIKTLGSSFWLCCTYFFTTANPERGSKLSTRILLGSWSLFLFIIVTALSSCLVSTMLVKGTEDHVDSLEDILRFPKLKILVERRTGFEHFIMLLHLFFLITQKTTTPFFKKLQRQVELIQGSTLPGAVQDDTFDRVEGGGHLLLHERYFQDATLAARYAKRGHCRFRRAPRGLHLQAVGMLLRKSLNQDMKRTINIHLRRAFELGLQNRPIEPFIFNASRCYAEEREEAAAYRLEDLQGAFFSLVLGFALASAIFSIEFAVNHSPRPKLRRRLVPDSGR